MRHRIACCVHAVLRSALSLCLFSRIDSPPGCLRFTQLCNTCTTYYNMSCVVWVACLVFLTRILRHVVQKIAHIVKDAIFPAAFASSTINTRFLAAHNFTTLDSLFIIRLTHTRVGSLGDGHDRIPVSPRGVLIGSRLFTIFRTPFCVQDNPESFASDVF